MKTFCTSRNYLLEVITYMVNFCSLLALSPEDVLPAVYLCTNKIAPDHENVVRVILSFAQFVSLDEFHDNIPAHVNMYILIFCNGSVNQEVA